MWGIYPLAGYASRVTAHTLLLRQQTQT